MRILTVRQPWAWAIIHAGKDVENRSRNIAGSYRGPVLIHAGLTAVDHDDALWDRDRFRDALASTQDRQRMSVRGAILGVVDLVGVHDADWCWNGPGVQCSPWAEGDTDGSRISHLVLRNPRPLDEPVPYRGGLGLRRAPFTVADSRLVADEVA